MTEISVAGLAGSDFRSTPQRKATEYELERYKQERRWINRLPVDAVGTVDGSFGVAIMSIDLSKCRRSL